MVIPEEAGGQGEKGERNHRDCTIHSEEKNMGRKGNNQNIKRPLIFKKFIYLLTRSLLCKRRSCSQTF